MVQAWLVALHDQDVVRLLDGDQELGVLALGGPSAAECRVPRRALPSTATARRPARPGEPAAASQELTAASRRPASTDSRTRRIVASPGGRNRPASGSNRTSSAANDRAPASTAATEISRTEASEWRTPRG